MSLLSWLIPVAYAADPPRKVNVCRSFFNFLHLPCAGTAGATATSSSIVGLTTRIIVFVLSTSATVVMVMIVYAGYVMIFSSAFPDQLEKARKIMTYCLCGLVVVMCAFVLTSGVRIIIYSISFS